MKLLYGALRSSNNKIKMEDLGSSLSIPLMAAKNIKNAYTSVSGECSLLGSVCKIKQSMIEYKFNYVIHIGLGFLSLSFL